MWHRQALKFGLISAPSPVVETDPCHQAQFAVLQCHSIAVLTEIRFRFLRVRTQSHKLFLPSGVRCKYAVFRLSKHYLVPWLQNFPTSPQWALSICRNDSQDSGKYILAVMGVCYCYWLLSERTKCKMHKVLGRVLALSEFHSR